ncbi:hypothetical protein BC827DRAFT_36256 [Russula dissimulans]|nr:hypothetical protein BC827DRAFT_36256 [Russula dissimulans]
MSFSLTQLLRISCWVANERLRVDCAIAQRHVYIDRTSPSSLRSFAFLPYISCPHHIRLDAPHAFTCSLLSTSSADFLIGAPKIHPAFRLAPLIKAILSSPKDGVGIAMATSFHETYRDMPSSAGLQNWCTFVNVGPDAASQLPGFCYMGVAYSPTTMRHNQLIH